MIDTKDDTKSPHHHLIPITWSSSPFHRSNRHLPLHPLIASSSSSSPWYPVFSSLLLTGCLRLRPSNSLQISQSLTTSAQTTPGDRLTSRRVRTGWSNAFAPSQPSLSEHTPQLPATIPLVQNNYINENKKPWEMQYCVIMMWCLYLKHQGKWFSWYYKCLKWIWTGFGKAMIGLSPSGRERGKNETTQLV